ncbi:hypothetical protein [Candidatus Tisiphia endosymbiont of Hybos culiciformis]
MSFPRRRESRYRTEAGMTLNLSRDNAKQDCFVATKVAHRNDEIMSYKP